MKWYAVMLFLLVGFVWSVSAQQMDPKLVGTWETGLDHRAGHFRPLRIIA